MAEDIRILHIITKLAVGGAQMNTLISTREISKMGYPSTVLTGPERPPEGDLYSLAEEWGIDVITIPHLKRDISLYNDIRAFFEIRKIIKDGHFNIIHTHSSKAKILGRLAAASVGNVKIIQTVHGWSFFNSTNRLKKRLFALFEKMGFYIAETNIVVSPLDIEKGVKQGIGSPEDYILVRSGVEFRDFKNSRGKRVRARDKIGLSPDLSVVGAVMRLDAQKAPHLFVKVAEIIHANMPDVHFVIAGDGPLRKRTEIQIEKAGLSSVFHLPGSCSNVPELLPAFDAFLITSRSEGLPRTMLEALATGIPVVATNVGGISELVDGKKNGILCDDGDIDALSAGVMDILSTPGLSEKLLENVDNDLIPFSAEQMVRDLYKLYTNTIHRKLKVVFICDDEPFNIPYAVDYVIRANSLNDYAVITVPGHGSFSNLALNLKRYMGLYGFWRFTARGFLFLFYKFLAALNFYSRSPHSLMQTSKRRKVPFRRIVDINSPEAEYYIKSLSPDVIISIACPQILKDNILSIPSKGAWNVHSAILPRNRGMMPAFWSLLNGDTPGVTIHKMARKLDSGELLIQREINESIETISLHGLLRRSKETAAVLIVEALHLIETGDYELSANPSERGSYNKFPTCKDLYRFIDRGGSVSGKVVPISKIALSFDIEEWFQTTAARKSYPPDVWNDMESRVDAIIDKILDLLERHNSRATFFLLGWIIERHPDMIHTIVENGHEIACHGYDHSELAWISIEQFRKELEYFQELINMYSLPQPTGFRAPSFSLIHGKKLIIHELLAHGYSYDSSVYPMFKYRYGIPNAPLTPFLLKEGEKSILELPLSSFPFINTKLPVAGGAYMRFMPGFAHRFFLKRISKSGRIPVLYCHPWELDTININRSMNHIQQFRQHYNSGKVTVSRLHRILRKYRGITLAELAEYQTEKELETFSLYE